MFIPLVLAKGLKKKPKSNEGRRWKYSLIHSWTLLVQFPKLQEYCASHENPNYMGQRNLPAGWPAEQTCILSKLNLKFSTFCAPLPPAAHTHSVKVHMHMQRQRQRHPHVPSIFGACESLVGGDSLALHFSAPCWCASLMTNQLVARSVLLWSHKQECVRLQSTWASCSMSFSQHLLMAVPADEKSQAFSKSTMNWAFLHVSWPGLLYLIRDCVFVRESDNHAKLSLRICCTLCDSSQQCQFDTMPGYAKTQQMLSKDSFHFSHSMPGVPQPMDPQNQRAWPPSTVYMCLSYSWRLKGNNWIIGHESTSVIN